MKFMAIYREPTLRWLAKIQFEASGWEDAYRQWLLIQPPETTLYVIATDKGTDSEIWHNAVLTVFE